MAQSKRKSEDSVRKECKELIDLAGKFPPNTEAFRQGALAALKWAAGLTPKRPSGTILTTGPIERVEREREKL